MLAELVVEGLLPALWVSCDEGYGRSVDFLDGVTALGLGYVAEVPVDTRVWPERPPTVVPRTRVRLAPEAPASMEARSQTLPHRQVQRARMLLGLARVDHRHGQPRGLRVPADRYFLQLCRVNVLYNVLTHVAWPDGTRRTHLEHDGHPVRGGSEGSRLGHAPCRRRCGCHCNLPRHYPPEEHAAQAALLFRAHWATNEG